MPNKFFRQVTEQPEKADRITVEWASMTADDYIQQIKTYMESCVKTESQVERIKYYESAIDCLGHICIANQMIGALTDPDTIIHHFFGEIPVEIVTEEEKGEQDG